MIKKRIIHCIFLVLLSILSSSAFADRGLILSITDPISPATQNYIERGLLKAAKDYQLVILEMNVPGGLYAAVRGINKAILASAVPVVAYVSPSGANVAREGIFMMYASHFAYMAPATTLGVRAPLMVNEKSQDVTAYIHSIAETRDRNAEWGQKLMTDTALLTADEAEKNHVINGILANYKDIASNISGKATQINNKMATLDLNEMSYDLYPEDWQYHFLSILTNPNVLYFLILITIYGIFFQLSNFGNSIIPGIFGMVALIFSIYALELVPVNYFGLFLVVIGVLSLILEVYAFSYGVIGIIGMVCFVAGSVLLFDINNPYYHLQMSLIIFMSFLTLVFFFIILKLAISAQQKSVITGIEAFVGLNGEVISVINGHITIRISGEIWEAKSDFAVEPGNIVKVKNIEGLMLKVEPDRE